ncbi:MAG: hypothetical protein V1841_02465 [Patescibacteria group bacterium]
MFEKEPQFKPETAPEIKIEKTGRQEKSPEKFDFEKEEIKDKIKETSGPEEEIKKELQEITFKKYKRFGATVEEIIESPDRHLNDYLKSFHAEQKRPIKEIKQEFEKGASKWSIPGKTLELRDVKYTSEDGKSISLGSLLPKGWKFIKTTELFSGANPEAREIHYAPPTTQTRKTYEVPKDQRLPEEGEYFSSRDHIVRLVNRERRKVREDQESFSVSKKGFFLGVLHEIGHANFYTEMTQKERQNYITARKLAGETENNPWAVKYIVRDERQAWAWALREFRKLRKGGIDFEPALSSNKEIIKLVESKLSSYKKSLTPQAYNEARRIVWDRRNKK